MTITTEELQAIRARAEAATEGPWMYDVTDNVMNSDAPNYKEMPVIAEDFPFKPDAEFIAASREDVPKLLAEVERLKSWTAQIAEENTWVRTEIRACELAVEDEALRNERYTNEIGKLKAEIERLRNENESLAITLEMVGGCYDE